MLKKLLLLIIIVGIGYGIYWMINKEGAIEIKNKVVSIFQRNEVIENLIENDEMTVDSGIVFSGTDESVDISGNNIQDTSDTEIILDNIGSGETVGDTGSNDKFVENNTTATVTTPKTITTAPKTVKTTKTTTSSTSILNTLFK